jgi:hypothetical protein
VRFSQDCVFAPVAATTGPHFVPVNQVMHSLRDGHVPQLYGAYGQPIRNDEGRPPYNYPPPPATAPYPTPPPAAGYYSQPPGHWTGYAPPPPAGAPAPSPTAASQPGAGAPPPAAAAAANPEPLNGKRKAGDELPPNLPPPNPAQASHLQYHPDYHGAPPPASQAPPAQYSHSSAPPYYGGQYATAPPPRLESNGYQAPEPVQAPVAAPPPPQEAVVTPSSTHTSSTYNHPATLPPPQPSTTSSSIGQTNGNGNGNAGTVSPTNSGSPTTANGNGRMSIRDMMSNDGRTAPDIDSAMKARLGLQKAAAAATYAAKP